MKPRLPEIIITHVNPKDSASITESGEPTTDAVPLMHHAHGMSPPFFSPSRNLIADGKGKPIAKPSGAMITADATYLIGSGRDIRDVRIG